jgi:fused signal recognition particle receptor
MVALLIVVIVVGLLVLGGGAYFLIGRRRGAIGPGPDRPAVPPAGPAPPLTAPPPAIDEEAGPPAAVEDQPAVEDRAAVEEVEAPVTADQAESLVEEAERLLEAPAEPEPVPEEVEDEDLELVEAPGARPRFRDRLGKARNLFSSYLAQVRSKDRIDAETWDDLEEALILGDVGVEVTTAVLADLRVRVKQDRIEHPEDLLRALKEDLVARMDGDRTLHLEPDVTNVWLFVGVNGVGKTTTIGKLGLRHRQEGRRVVLAAGDTFRAAAADQLAIWGERVGAPVIRGKEGGDPGAVVFDAVQSAAARGADLVLADTAGRLHTKVNLMEELKKVRRVAERPPGKVTEVLLVVDATTGQNGLLQAKQFAAAVGVTGVVLTKLDGTAKGGIAVAIASELGLPIKLVGLGEAPEDLVDFDPQEYVDALVAES